MSEKLTAKTVLENVCWRHWGQTFDTLCSNDGNQQSGFWAPLIREAMEEYAVLQVQYIKEERDKALDHLKEANSILNISGYRIEPWSPFAQQLQDFLTSINKINE